jgi:tRNA-specific 2-thiouridylase
VLKFDLLVRRAEMLGACGVATGHYARLAPGPDGGPALFRARDRAKDQTYFLFDLSRSVLPRLAFPLGELHKHEVREVARGLALATADKPESQGICFIPDGDVRGALRSRVGGAPEPGPIVDADGERGGEHQGAAGYTVGQRQGLGVALGEARYVSRVDTRTNMITLARREDLETRTMELEDVRFVAGAAPDGASFRADVRIRHRGALVPSTIHPESRPRAGSDPRPSDAGARWIVETDSPVWAASPGQAAVFYDGERCLGGGRIALDRAA